MARLLRILPAVAATAASLCSSACSDAVAFGPPRTLPASDRKIDWEVSDKTRLMLRDLGPAEGQEPGQATGFTAELPEGWETQPPRQFRDASWRVRGTEAECALLAAVGGGLRGNVDRWCDQFGAARLSDAALASAPAGELLGKPARVIELQGSFQGKSDWALLALITEGDPLATLKFTGPKAVVAAQRDAFLRLGKTLRAGGGPAPAGQPAAAPAPAATGGFTATLPAGWTQRAAEPERFRDAVFAVGDGGDCAYTAAVGGGLRTNVDRWCGQFGLPPLGDAQLTNAPQHALAGQSARLIELQGSFRGKPEQAMLALITDGTPAATLKLTGPAALVGAQKSNFLQVAATLRAGAAPAAPANPAPAAPHPAPSPNGAANAGPFTATIPAGWQPKAGSSRPLHHTFGTQGEVYANSIGGALREQLAIWRGELQLAPLTDAEFAALPVQSLLGGDGVLLDLRGDFRGTDGRTLPGARVLVAARAVDGAVVFAKLFGPAAEVTEAEAAFRSFCASLRRHP